MSRRSARQRRTSKHYPSRTMVMAALVLAVVGISAGAFGVLRSRGAEAEPSGTTKAIRVAAARAETQPSAVIASAPAVAQKASTIEVPSVVGLPVAEARLVLDAAGFSVRVDGSPKGGEARSSVTTQTPSAGTISARETIVVLGVKPGLQAVSTAMATQGTEPVGDGLVVVIDPGHQRHSDPKPEPIGPGSHKTKAGVSGGTTGIATKLPEYEVALQISMNLKRRLEAAGVMVVMTRTTNDVRLTNSQRAKVANEAKADLFVRVHCDGSPESKLNGISTLYPGKNRWTTRYVSESKAAASAIQSKVVASTEAVDRGIGARTDLTGFNYSKMPSVLVETGFMSNPVEDRLLSSPHYQDKLASGMTEGILAYLAGESGRAQ